MVNTNKKSHQLKLNEMIESEEVIGSQIVVSYDQRYIKGKTIRYEIADGIWAIYHDIESMVQGIYPEETHNSIKMNYCISGRCECVYRKNKIIYIGAKDFVVGQIKERFDIHQFPFGRYLGFSIEMPSEKLDRFLHRLFPNSDISAKLVLDKIETVGPFLITNNNSKIHNIFMEMMNSNQCFKKERAVLKLAELILYILSDDLLVSDIEGRYYSHELINKIKQIKTSVTSDIENYMKIEEISKQYNISKKVFTECFKTVYGKTYYAFIKEYRIQQAAEMLGGNQIKISDVAISVGYQNASKFSKAFSDVMGVSPSNYKKSFYIADLE